MFPNLQGSRPAFTGMPSKYGGALSGASRQVSTLLTGWQQTTGWPHLVQVIVPLLLHLLVHIVRGFPASECHLKHRL
jgi:hypothetical protein